MPKQDQSPKIRSFQPSSAPEGKEVEILGENLKRVTQVTFKENLAANFSVASTKKIIATVPQGVEAGEIRIMTSFGNAKSKDSFVPIRFPLSVDTQIQFRGFVYKCSNLGLLLDRYIGYKYFKHENKWQFKEEDKASFLKEIKENFRFDEMVIEHNHVRWQAIARSLHHHQIFTASPEWRMVVGLGQSSILETSITLDRITGIPIIPGSALKGLAASYAMLCELETTSRDEAEANPEFKAIFGSQEQVGAVIFLDAIPTKVPKLEPDIMNNHHSEYYSDQNGQTPPAPWDSPNPVYFLTLGQSSEFTFAVAGRDKKESTQGLVNQGIQWLKNGLSELGVGAKTASGYGYMPVEE